MGRRFTALDLGSGPGSLSARLLRRFPRGRSVAVDYDPVSLRVGQGALGSSGGRLQWVDARLGHPGWTERLPRRRYDAALSTTALHWLTAPALGRLYRDLHGLLRPGGVLLNGDHLPWESRAAPTLPPRRVGTTRPVPRSEPQLGVGGVEEVVGGRGAGPGTSAALPGTRDTAVSAPEARGPHPRLPLPDVAPCGIPGSRGRLAGRREPRAVRDPVIDSSESRRGRAAGRRA